MASLEILFQTTYGADVVKTFTRKPLGMDFAMQMPLTVCRARKESLSLGVQKGWVVKAVGGKSFDDIDIETAFEVLKTAVDPLRKDPDPVSAFVPATLLAFTAKFGPVDTDKVVGFLQNFGYQSKDHLTWDFESPRPTLKLGDICGHREKGLPYQHTWYMLKCRLEHTNGPKVWWVERRLAHMRACLHDPIRRELGSTKYNRLFNKAHFAHHCGPPGTTARLRLWLSALSTCINSGEVSPAMTASTLHFLQAPDLSRPWEAARNTPQDNPHILPGWTPPSAAPASGEEGASLSLKDKDEATARELSEELAAMPEHLLVATDLGRENTDMSLLGAPPPSELGVDDPTSSGIAGHGQRPSLMLQAYAKIEAAGLSRNGVDDLPLREEEEESSIPSLIVPEEAEEDWTAQVDEGSYRGKGGIPDDKDEVKSQKSQDSLYSF